MCSSGAAVYTNVTPKATIEESIFITSLLNLTSCLQLIRIQFSNMTNKAFRKCENSKEKKNNIRISLKVVTLIS